jgi:hypothetical protein
MVSLAAEAFGGARTGPGFSVFRLPVYVAKTRRNTGKIAGLDRLAASACKIVGTPFTGALIVREVRKISSMIYRVIKP